MLFKVSDERSARKIHPAGESPKRECSPGNSVEFRYVSWENPPARAHSRFFTFAVSAIAMLLAAHWGSKLFPPAALAAYFSGHIVLLWGLCMEIIGWAERSAALENRLSVETIAMTILFGIYAVILVGGGVAARSAINRLAGLGLTGIVILKLYLFDVW